MPGGRPAVLERLLAEIRAAFGAPRLNPDSPGELLRALQAAGLPVSDTSSWTLEQLDQITGQASLAALTSASSTGFHTFIHALLATASGAAHRAATDPED